MRRGGRAGGGVRAAGVPGVHLRAAAAGHGRLRRGEHRVRAWREGAQRRLQGEARRAAPHRRQALQPLRLARPAPVPGICLLSPSLILSSNNVRLLGVTNALMPLVRYWLVIVPLPI